MTMSIKDHIDAGHYPVDEKGRALVPTHDRAVVATICATDAPGERPLLGFIRGDNHLNTVKCCDWDADGNHCPSEPRACWVDLLPPLPRKREVKRWAVVRIADQAVMDTAATRDGAASSHARYHPHDMERYRVVELTGSYEEDWPS